MAGATAGMCVYVCVGDVRVSAALFQITFHSKYKFFIVQFIQCKSANSSGTNKTGGTSNPPNGPGPGGYSGFSNLLNE